MVCQDRFLGLAGQRQFAAKQKMADNLLRDRRCTDRPLPAVETRDIGHRGAEDRLRIDALMRVEVPVLGGEKGVDDKSGHFADRYGDAPLGLEFSDQLAVSIVDLAADRGDVIRDLLKIRQIVAEIVQAITDGDRSAGNAEQHEHEGETRYTAQTRQQHHSLAVLAETLWAEPAGPTARITLKPAEWQLSSRTPASGRNPSRRHTIRNNPGDRMVPKTWYYTRQSSSGLSTAPRFLFPGTTRPRTGSGIGHAAAMEPAAAGHWPGHYPRHCPVHRPRRHARPGRGVLRL